MALGRRWALQSVAATWAPQPQSLLGLHRGRLWQWLWTALGPGRGAWGAWKAMCWGPWRRGWAETGRAPALWGPPAPPPPASSPFRAGHVHINVTCAGQVSSLLAPSREHVITFVLHYEAALLSGIYFS